MTDLISFTQNAFALYPNADAVDAWADRLLERAAHTEANAAFSRYTPIRTSFGNGPNALASRYVRFEAENRRPFYGYWQPALTDYAWTCEPDTQSEFDAYCFLRHYQRQQEQE